MDGQISLFDVGVKAVSSKPEVGAKVMFFYEGKSYPAYVSYYVNDLSFVIIFKDERPCAASGWHVSVKDYKNTWDYLEESEG